MIIYLVCKMLRGEFVNQVCVGDNTGQVSLPGRGVWNQFGSRLVALLLYHPWMDHCVASWMPICAVLS